MQSRARRAIDDFLRFAHAKRLFTVPDYAPPALRARISSYKSPNERVFFDEVDLSDPRVMRCHPAHWIDKARMIKIRWELTGSAEPLDSR